MKDEHAKKLIVAASRMVDELHRIHEELHHVHEAITQSKPLDPADAALINDSLGRARRLVGRVKQIDAGTERT